MEQKKQEKSFTFPVCKGCLICTSLHVCLAQECYLSCCLFQDIIAQKEKEVQNAQL